MDNLDKGFVYSPEVSASGGDDSVSSPLTAENPNALEARIRELEERLKNDSVTQEEIAKRNELDRERRAQEMERISADLSQDSRLSLQNILLKEINDLEKSIDDRVSLGTPDTVWFVGSMWVLGSSFLVNNTFGLGIGVAMLCRGIVKAVYGSSIDDYDGVEGMFNELKKRLAPDVYKEESPMDGQDATKV